MSVEATSSVWRHSRAKGNDRLVLLAIADHAWSDGTHAFPSQTRIADMTRLSESTARRAIRALERLGELATHPHGGPKAEGDRHRPNFYWMPLVALGRGGQFDRSSDPQPVKSASTAGQIAADHRSAVTGKPKNPDTKEIVGSLIPGQEARTIEKCGRTTAASSITRPCRRCGCGRSSRWPGVPAAQVGAGPAALGPHRRTIHTWPAQQRSEGRQALRARPLPGRAHKLPDEQLGELAALLTEADPREHGFAVAPGTRQIVRQLIHRRFGVQLTVAGVGRTPHELGFSAQRPLYRAEQADPAALARWKESEYPTIAAQATAAGGTVFLVEEAEVRSAYPAGTTRAPLGQTPP